MYKTVSSKLSKEVANCVAKYADYYFRSGKARVGNSNISLLASLYSLLPDIQEKSVSLGPFKASFSYNSVHRDVEDILSQEILDLSKIFTKEDINMLIEHFKELVEYSLNFYNSDKSVRYIGEYSQPSQLTRMCLEIAAFEKGNHIYNPFSGLASYPVMNEDCCYECEELSQYTWALSQINLFAHNCNATVRYCDAFHSLGSRDKYYDGIIMTPPFAMRGRNRTEIDAVRLAIENKLKVGGKMVVVLPSSILFSASRTSVELMDMLFREHYLNMVVTLPNIFIPYAGISTCILSISKKSNDSCLLVDGTSFIGEENGAIRKVLLVDKLLSVINEEDNQYCIRLDSNKLSNLNNLIPRAHLPIKNTTDYPTKKLGDLITVYRSLSVDSEIVSRTMKVISPKVLSLKDIDLSIGVDKLDNAEPKNQQCIVDSNSILLYPSDKGMRIGRIREIPDNIIVSCSPHIHTAKISSDEITEEFLLLQLTSEFVTEQISRLFTAASHGVFPYRYFLDLEIPVPSLEEQAKLLQAYYQANMSEKEKALDDSKRKFESQIHLRKHAITQTLSAMSALWNTLNDFRISHKGLLSDGDVVSKSRHMNVGDTFDAISHRINTLLVQTENLANIEYNWGDSKLIVPSTFIHNYIERHQDVRFMLLEDDFVSKDSFGIYFPERALERIFDNIISNAISHGFNDPSRINYKVYITEIVEDFDIFKICIMNNGTPIPESVNNEDVFEYGFSTALTELDENGHEHVGIGAFEVRNILNDFGGSVKIYSTPENEYTVSYELIFTKTNIDDE